MPFKKIPLFLVNIFAFSQVLSAKDIHVPSSFVYRFQKADVFCWQKGVCAGEMQEGPRGEMGDALAHLIQKTKKKLSFALYGVRNQAWFLETLQDLKSRGVEIRGLVDQFADLDGGFSNPDNFPYPDAVKLADILGPRWLKADVNGDGSPRQSFLMHNKFLVVDERYLWVSTANVSDTEIGSEYYGNTSLSIDSSDLAKFYLAEFDQMFQERKHGVHKRKSMEPVRLIYQDGTSVSVGFSPQDSVIDTLIVPSLSRAKEEIFISQFFLTDRRLWRALIQAKRRGVKVRVMIDAGAASHPSSFHKELRQAGIEVRVENLGGKMHMKNAVIDKQITLIGSMNWSKSGDTQNDENTLLIENNRALSGELAQYMEELWREFELLVGRPDAKAESPASVNACFDGLDNDHDGSIDADDSSCY